jgi:carboxymethylenebutenolidase
MELETAWVDIIAAGGTCRAYRARPQATPGPLPGVLLIQEIWGVDEHIRDLTERFAASGYLALAPDLYSAGERVVALAPDRIAAVKRFLDSLAPRQWGDAAARERALESLPDGARARVAASLGALFGPRDAEATVAVLRDAVAWLRADPACDGHVGSVGWCMGGGLSARLACREPGLSGAAVFYGSPPPETEIAAIACPVIGFYGGEDARITDSVPGFGESMRKVGKSFEAHIYPGAPHAFFNDTRRSYDPDAARDAWARCLLFFARHLAPHVWQDV